MSDFSGRIERLQMQLREQAASGIVIAGTDQMRYLTGWREGGHERFVGLLVPSSGDPAFLVPAMNAEQAKKTPSGIERVVGWDDAAGWIGSAREIMSGWPDGETLLVDDDLHSVHLLDLQTLFPGRRWRAAGATMARLRKVKTPEELAAMERAAARIDAVFEQIAPTLRSGVTEAQVATAIVEAIRAGDSEPSFSPLVCFGANAALPHHHTGAARLQPGDVVIIDIGCTDSGYASDITRTIAYGEPSDPDARRIYSIVMAAHSAARKTAVPGVSGEIVDAAARRVITDAGYGAEFLHRTGHGIGLSVHEPPNIVAGSVEPLQPGNCFSVEPGIYLSGRFGVRIENIVTMTEQGCRSLNSEPDPELRILPVTA